MAALSITELQLYDSAEYHRVITLWRHRVSQSYNSMAALRITEL